MTRHRVAKMAVASLIGLSATAVLFGPHLGATASRGLETIALDLPWPYCAPDAKPPGFAPLPLAQGIDRPIAVLPLADALLPIERIELVGDPMTEQDFEGKQIAAAQTEPAIFRSGSSIPLFGTLAGGPESIVSDAPLLQALADRLALGHRVIVGVDARWDDGTLSFGFAIDLTTGEVMRHGTYAGSDNAILLDFVRSRFPDSSSGPALAELLVNWNREQDEAIRPISDEWAKFVRDTYGIGLNVPEPGTEEWWQAAPSQCRSLLDAPPSVTAKLDPVTVWVRVPTGIVAPMDAVICLHIELGSMGCSSFRPDPESEYTQLTAFSDGVNPISVQIARETPDGISWIDRTEIASIPGSLAASAQAVLVTLGPDLSGSSYDEIASNARIAESSVSVLSVEREQEIAEAIV